VPHFLNLALPQNMAQRELHRARMRHIYYCSHKYIQKSILQMHKRVGGAHRTNRSAVSSHFCASSAVRVDIQDNYLIQGQRRGDTEIQKAPGSLQTEHPSDPTDRRITFHFVQSTYNSEVGTETIIPTPHRHPPLSAHAPRLHSLRLLPLAMRSFLPDCVCEAKPKEWILPAQAGAKP